MEHLGPKSICKRMQRISSFRLENKKQPKSLLTGTPAAISSLLTSNSVAILQSNFLISYIHSY